LPNASRSPIIFTDTTLCARDGKGSALCIEIRDACNSGSSINEDPVRDPQGAVIVPAGVTKPEQLTPLNQNPYGISSVSGRQPDNVPEENRVAMRYLIDRIVSIVGGIL
jgi:hypothetical protein